MTCGTATYWISEVTTGRLAIIAHPRCRDELRAEVSAWSCAGLNAIVCLLDASELSYVELNDARASCESSNIEFIAFPVREGGVPSSVRRTKKLVERVVDLLSAGASVAVYSRADIGRSALVAGAVLIKLGFSYSSVFSMLGAVGVPVPATPIQAQWLCSYSVDVREPSKLERFLVPETDVSLKLWFDNIRNYIIACVALYAPLIQMPESSRNSYPPWLILCLYLVILTLSTLNFLQSVRLARRALDTVNTWVAKKTSPLPTLFRLPLMWLTVLVLLSLFLTMAATVMGLVLILLQGSLQRAIR